jgi:hypothetical protein
MNQSLPPVSPAVVLLCPGLVGPRAALTFNRQIAGQNPVLEPVHVVIAEHKGPFEGKKRSPGPWNVAQWVTRQAGRQVRPTCPDPASE